MKPTTRRVLKDYGTAVAFAIGVALIIRFFLIEAYRIPSPSMRPTLEAGDTIFVSKWPRGSKAPKIGDVVVFSEERGRDYIKRIVALPGDRVEVRKGRLTINGRALETRKKKEESCGQEILPNGAAHPACWDSPALANFNPEQVPPGHVFVIGDYRGEHGPSDSRSGPAKPKGWGIIPVSSIKGAPLWIWLSVEPSGQSGTGRGFFSRFRFERMFRRIQ